MEILGKTAVFSGLIWPGWGNTTWADMAGLGSIDLSSSSQKYFSIFKETIL